MIRGDTLKQSETDKSSNYYEGSFDRDALINLDIDKQIWLAKQQELSECEIILRKKKRHWYWVRKNVLILFVIITLIIMAYWKEIARWIQMKIR